MPAAASNFSRRRRIGDSGSVPSVPGTLRNASSNVAVSLSSAALNSTKCNRVASAPLPFRERVRRLMIVATIWVAFGLLREASLLTPPVTLVEALVPVVYMATLATRGSTAGGSSGTSSRSSVDEASPKRRTTAGCLGRGMFLEQCIWWAAAFLFLDGRYLEHATVAFLAVNVLQWCVASLPLAAALYTVVAICTSRAAFFSELLRMVQPGLVSVLNTAGFGPIDVTPATQLQLAAIQPPAWLVAFCLSFSIQQLLVVNNVLLPVREQCLGIVVDYLAQWDDWYDQWYEKRTAVGKFLAKILQTATHIVVPQLVTTVVVWYALMLVEWNAKLSIGGILLSSSVIVGPLAASGNPDTGKVTTGGNAVSSSTSQRWGSRILFIASVLIADGVIAWLAAPAFIPVLANGILSAHFVLYLSHVREPAFLTMLPLVFLWVAMITFDMWNQLRDGGLVSWGGSSLGVAAGAGSIAVGETIGGVFRRYVATNTVGFGILLLSSTFADSSRSIYMLEEDLRVLRFLVNPRRKEALDADAGHASTTVDACSAEAAESSPPALPADSKGRQESAQLGEDVPTVENFSAATQEGFLQASSYASGVKQGTSKTPSSQSSFAGSGADVKASAAASRAVSRMDTPCAQNQGKPATPHQSETATPTSAHPVAPLTVAKRQSPVSTTPEVASHPAEVRAMVEAVSTESVSSATREVPKPSSVQNVEKRDKDKQKSMTAAIVAAAAAEIERRRLKQAASVPESAPPAEQQTPASPSANVNHTLPSSKQPANAPVPAPPNSLDVDESHAGSVSATATQQSSQLPSKKGPSSAKNSSAKNVSAATCPTALTPSTTEPSAPPAAKPAPKTPIATNVVSTPAAAVPPAKQAAGKLSFGDVVRGAKSTNAPNVATTPSNLTPPQASSTVAPLSVDGDLPPSGASQNSGSSIAAPKPAEKGQKRAVANPNSNRVGPVDVGGVDPAVAPTAVGSAPHHAIPQPKSAQLRAAKEVATFETASDVGAVTPPNLTSPLVKAIMSIDMHEDDNTTINADEDDEQPLIDATDCAVATTPSFGPVAVSPQCDRSRAPTKEAAEAAPPMGSSFDAFMGMRQLSLMMTESIPHHRVDEGGERPQVHVETTNAIDLAMFHMALTGNTNVRCGAPNESRGDAASPLVTTTANLDVGLSPVSRLDEVISQLSTAGNSPLPHGAASLETPTVNSHGKPSPTNFIAELTRAVSNAGAASLVASNLTLQLSGSVAATGSDAPSTSTPASANEDMGGETTAFPYSLAGASLPASSAVTQNDDLQNLLTPEFLTMLDDDGTTQTDRGQASAGQQPVVGPSYVHHQQHVMLHNSAPGSFTVTSHPSMMVHTMAPQHAMPQTAVPNYGYVMSQQPQQPSDAAMAIAHMQQQQQAAYIARQQPAPAYSPMPGAVSYMNASSLPSYPGTNAVASQAQSTFASSAPPPLIMTPQGHFALLNINGQPLMVPVVYQQSSTSQNGNMQQVPTYGAPPSPSHQPSQAPQPLPPHVSPSKRQ